MNREDGWYKVKFEGKWTCMYYNKGDVFPWFVSNRLLNSDWFYHENDIDEIGEKIIFDE